MTTSELALAVLVIVMVAAGIMAALERWQARRVWRIDGKPYKEIRRWQR